MSPGIGDPYPFRVAESAARDRAWLRLEGVGNSDAPLFQEGWEAGAAFWRGRYEEQHRTLHNMEDEIARLRTKLADVRAAYESLPLDYRGLLEEKDEEIAELRLEAAKWHQAWVNNANRMEGKLEAVERLMTQIGGLREKYTEPLGTGDVDWATLGMEALRLATSHEEGR